MATATATATVWAKPCSWALDSEEHEEELSQQQETSDFPSLSAAAVVTKTKKKKAQTKTVSLFELNTGKTQQPSNKGLTPTELLNLPTGPRERSAEELERSRLGGGGDSSSRWGRDRGVEEPPRRREPPPPSKADEVDDWGAAKRTLPQRGSSGFGGRGDSPSSRADESDSWVSKKSFAPSSDSRMRTGERRGVGFDNGGGGRADSNNWGRKGEVEDSNSEIGNGRPRLVLQPRSLSVTNAEQPQPASAPKTNPFGAARPREEVLAEKGQDWKKIDEKLQSFKIRENDFESNSWRKTASPTPSEEKEDTAGENTAAEN